MPKHLDDKDGEVRRHERRVVGHASGWQEQMDTCICGKPWPCPSIVSHALPKTVRGEAGDWIDAVVLDICEIPDRTSPDDEPEIMLVKADELRRIILTNVPVAQSRAPGSNRGAEGSRSSGDTLPSTTPQKTGWVRWLIERTYAHQREYWTGIGSYHTDDAKWTADPLEAASYATKDIAYTLRLRHFHPEHPVDVCDHMFNCGISQAPSPLGGLAEVLSEYDGIVNGRLDPRDAEADFVMRGSDWRVIREAISSTPSATPFIEVWAVYRGDELHAIDPTYLKAKARRDMCCPPSDYRLVRCHLAASLEQVEPAGLLRAADGGKQTE